MQQTDKPLTVAQVIEKLKELPRDAPCYIGYDCFYKRAVTNEYPFFHQFEDEYDLRMLKEETGYEGNGIVILGAAD